jgi:hypothetical protein
LQFCSLVASKGRLGHPVLKGKREILVIKVPLALLVHHQAHREDLDQVGGLAAVEAL